MLLSVTFRKDIVLKPVVLLSLISLTDIQLDNLQAVSLRLEIHQLPQATIEDVPDDLCNRIEIILGGGSLIRDPQPLPQLKWVQVQGAGVDGLQDTPVWRSDVMITNASGIHATPIAERTLAMMLAFRARLPEMWHLKQQATWPEDRWGIFSNPDLRDSILGIVGYGAIGGELARQASAIGMRVLAFNRSGERRPMDTYIEPGFGDRDMRIPEQVFGSSQLEDMLAVCDHVVILLPGTSATHHIIDEKMLACMKPSAFIYNFGRGAVIDEQALIAALQKGVIAGAGLDVFEQEPLPADSPLWQMPNVIITPHVGGMASNYNDRLIDLFTENLRKYLADQPLMNQVDREHGY
jgi:phosphoglycerate dehydrogenase-like enzyme